MAGTRGLDFERNIIGIPLSREYRVQYRERRASGDIATRLRLISARPTLAVLYQC